MNKPSLFLLFIFLWRFSDGFINSGSRTDIQSGFDCAMRQFAYEFGQSLFPSRGDFRTLFDSLQLDSCGMKTPSSYDQWIPPIYSGQPAGANSAVYVSPSGSDNNPGTLSQPFQTISKGVEKCGTLAPPCVVNLRGGTHSITSPVIVQTSSISIQNYQGERAEVTGAMELELGSWEPFSISPPESTWLIFPGNSNLEEDFVPGGDTEISFYLGSFSSSGHCASTATEQSTRERNFTAWTWISSHSPNGKQCYGHIGGIWMPSSHKGVVSGVRNYGKNIFMAKVNNWPTQTEMKGLRVNGGRGIRARYPNGDPEISMEYYPLNGYIRSPTNWVGPDLIPPSNVVLNASDYPGVEWPMNLPYPGSKFDGSGGDWGDYHVGVNGSCLDVDPPFGFWCASDSSAERGLPPHNRLDGLKADSSLLPNAPYKVSTNGVVHVWCDAHWFMWLCGIESEESDYSFDFASEACNQGAIGPYLGGGGEWYIENIMEEIDFPNEYYFDPTSKTLYYFSNTTFGVPPSSLLTFEGVFQESLFQIIGSDPTNPIKDVNIRGLVIKDAAYHYLDIHGLPSGGDWALHRGGAIFMENTENVVIQDLLVTRVDGNGVFVSGYNRGTVIKDCEFAWIGESAIAMWGYTTSNRKDFPPNVGPDGTDGRQPRGAKILRNLIHEVGIWQKQAAGFFQALSCQTILEGNVIFNGPRAGVNFNDGFGGGNELVRNLIFNTCRESSDHGPFNAWDRLNYITKVRTGQPSIIPANNEFHRNFIVANYAALWAIDTDDGASYYDVHHNFFVYGIEALKSDYGGHDHYQHDNIYSFTESAYGYEIPNPYFGGGNFDRFYNNRMIVVAGECRDLCYPSTCPDYLQPGMEVYANQIFTEDGNLFTCGMPLNEWQSQGNDVMSSVDFWPPNDVIIQWGKALLRES